MTSVQGDRGAERSEERHQRAFLQSSERFGRLQGTQAVTDERVGAFTADFSLEVAQELAAITCEVASTWEAVVAEVARHTFRSEPRDMLLYSDGMLAYSIMQAIGSLARDESSWKVAEEEVPLLRIALSVLDSGIRRFLKLAEAISPQYDIHKRTDEALGAVTSLRHSVGEWYVSPLANVEWRDS